MLVAWAPKPAALSSEQAGGAAANVETATRTLDLLGVQGGTTLLVAGAAGGVGTLVVQLAVVRGARVIGTAGPSTQDFVAGLGATPVVYGEGLADRVSGVGAVLHCAGTGPTSSRSRAPWTAEQGAFTVPLAEVFPLSEGAAAQRLSETRPRPRQDRARRLRTRKRCDTEVPQRFQCVSGRTSRA